MAGGCVPGLAQQGATPNRYVHGSEGVELSFGTFAQVTGSRNPGSTTNFGSYTVSQQVSQSATPSAGVLLSERQSFGPWLGYSVNVGFTRFTENYTSGSVATSNAPPFNVIGANFARGSIGTNAVELTGSYLVHARRGRYTPFAQLGGGMLVFVPTSSIQPVSYVYRGTGLFGVGLSYRVSERVELRAEYRGCSSRVRTSVMDRVGFSDRDRDRGRWRRYRLQIGTRWTRSLR